MGFFEKIKQGLSKTASSISSVFTASELDDDFYDDLEERLILADLGMDTTVKAVERLRLVVRDRRIKTVAEAREALREVLPLVDLVLVMSVEPGFGGQSFIPGSLEKIAQLRTMAREMGLETIIEVDGGLSSHNAGEVYGAGADVLVAGNAVFGVAYWMAEETSSGLAAVLMALTMTVAPAVPSRFSAVPTSVWSALKLMQATASRLE